MEWYELLRRSSTGIRWQTGGRAGSEERRKIRQGKKQTTVRRQETSCISAGGHGTELQCSSAWGCHALLTNNYICACTCFSQCLWVRTCRYISLLACIARAMHALLRKPVFRQCVCLSLPPRSTFVFGFVVKQAKILAQKS